MPKTKTRTEVVDKFKKELLDIKNLYKSKCVNWRGKTKDTKEFSSEIIASELLNELKEFDNILEVTRNKTYETATHSDIKINKDSNIDEENFAKRIIGLTLDDLGLIKDFQIPLKDNNEDEGLGKMDLISFNEKTNTLYLIELKYGDNKENNKKNNKETLLRASLESYTYYKTVNEEKLIKDYFKDIKHNEINVKPAVLVVPNCNAHKELEELKSGNRPKLKELALALDIKYFTLEFLTSETIL